MPDPRVLLLAVALLAGGGSALAQGLGGEVPRYTDRTLSATPLDAALRARHWAPGLNEGFVPQGLTIAHGSLLVGTYRSTDPKIGRGPARVFAVDPTNGAVTGAFALPAAIGHADGLEATPDGRTLYLADNAGVLHRFDLAASLAGGQAVAKGRPRALAKDPAIGANLLAYDGRLLWFGRYRRDGAPRLLAASPERLFGADIPFGAADAERDIPLPLYAQGAVFDAKGRLWVSASTGSLGRLYRLDPRTGAVLAEFPAVPGIEDLAVGEQGLLWSVSEAGSRRWNSWPTFYPLLFAFDPESLR
jgi:sugar lactone lactonase YvrE